MERQETREMNQKLTIFFKSIIDMSSGAAVTSNHPRGSNYNGPTAKHRTRQLYKVETWMYG